MGNTLVVGLALGTLVVGVVVEVLVMRLGLGLG